MTTDTDRIRAARQITPAIMRLLKYAETRGGAFVVWPVGIASATVKRAKARGLIEVVPNTRMLHFVEHRLTVAGRAALSPSDTGETDNG